MRLAAISIDLDEIPCYAAIHGLPPPEGEAAHAIYGCAVPRFERWLDEVGARATFFAIGSDLRDARARQAVQRLQRNGHEIGNHTFHHRYDFSRQAPEAMAADVDAGAEAIARATGQQPVGFRAPGYTVVDGVFELLQARGYRYDSSVFPCPPYYSAKTAAIGTIALRGRRSHSVVDHPRVLTAPADPYRVGRPYTRRGDGLLELPIGVTRASSGRLPYIGTSVVLAGAGGARWLTRRIVGRPLINLEMHGIDLADAEADGLGVLRAHQPDLRRSLAAKRAALQTAVSTLREAGYTLVTLAEAANELQSVPPAPCG
ncbi:MAG: polysaccharide deacetylase family protein [Myxococcales bacterium]|jgi:hypothetical protein